jgi:hypothetical protein
VAGCCEHGNESSGSIKGGAFRDQMSDCRSTLLYVVVFFTGLHEESDGPCRRDEGSTLCRLNPYTLMLM